MFISACACAVSAPPARAAFPVRPDEDGLVNGRKAVFDFGFDPGERRAKVVLVDDGDDGAYDPGSAVWQDQGRAESPWSTDGHITWNTRMFPGFYTWRLCSVGDATDPSTECDLQPEIRLVRVAEGNLNPCRGDFAGGFFRHLAVHRTSCGNAAGVMRAWLKRSRFGRRTPPKRLRVGHWSCRLRMFQTDENPYGQLTCTRGHRIVRNYGVS